MKGNEPIPKQKKNHRLKFTEIEDRLLKLAVSKVGTEDWQLVASVMGCRTARQCRDRWKHYLSPLTNTNEWTPAEDKLLLDNYRLLGSRWGALASLFPGRTSVGIRNRCCKLMKMKESLEFNQKINMTKNFSGSDLSEPSSPCETNKIVLPPISSIPFPSVNRGDNICEKFSADHPMFDLF